jgi:predicted AAA+ superfamily ATPase
MLNITSNTVALRVLIRHIINASATQKREVHALQSAMKELGLSKGTIVTWLDEDVSDQRIDILPVWKWLLTDG